MYHFWLGEQRVSIELRGWLDAGLVCWLEISRLRPVMNELPGRAGAYRS